MAAENVRNISQSAHHLSSNETCWLFRLPPEILQIITGYLTTADIQSLSQTCQTFHRFIDNNNFWICRIRDQFPQRITKLYTFDLFKKPEIIQTHNDIRPSGFAHIRAESELDLLAITSATHYNDEAIEKRHETMYVSKEDFLNNVEFYQFNKPHNLLEIPFMKFIYFYLIDRKRCATVDMNVTHRNDYYLVEEEDADSLTGHIIHLNNVCWLEINGRFEHKIMPGKYEVSWRMKGGSENVNIEGETEFLVVPQHGKLLIFKMCENDFREKTLEHGSGWFTVKIGQVIIYEPSIVLVAIRNWNNGWWKSGISWDCIEITLVP
jgi:Holliday junction resolvase